MDSQIGKQVCGRFLTYVRRYDIVPQPNPNDRTKRGIYPHPVTGLFLLQKAMWSGSDSDVKGDIVPLDQIRTLVDVSPRFGQVAPKELTKGTSVAKSKEFWLNKYFDKELFLALTL